MSERCPLSGGTFAYGVPDICEQNCRLLIEQAVKQGVLEYDIFDFNSGVIDKVPDSCTHEFTDLEFSHDSLQAVGASALRYYGTVDTCTGCGEEYGENVFSFECPRN